MDNQNKGVVMWDNWMKDFDPLNYNTAKKNVVQFNEKIVNFWKAWFHVPYLPCFYLKK